jgi:short-subunit dehydrogenase
MNKRIWFITGISSGLGKALAQSVIENGDYVIGTFRKQAQVDEFNKNHINIAEAVILDVTDFKQMESVVESIIQNHGKIDVLVNNAGVGFIGAIEESTIEEVRNVLEPNFYGALKLTQLVLPSMRARKSGQIIQISSHGGIKAFAGFGIYNASKFALEGFSEALAQEVTPLGIKVSIVQPGPFRTEFAGSGLGEAPKIIKDYAETSGKFKGILKGVHGKQEGDPVKAAHAIINHVKSESPTLRLPLGTVPLKTIQMKLDSVQYDLDINNEIAASVVY